MAWSLLDLSPSPLTTAFARTAMYRACIAVVDATRARLFIFERTTEPEAMRESLREHTDLVNPARRHPGELFADSRPGSSRIGGLPSTFDDHRGAHIDNL